MSGIASARCQTTNQNEQYFLRAGQKYDNKTDRRIRAIFEGIDLNRDKEISQEEIDAYEDYLQLKEKNKQRHSEIDPVIAKSNAPIGAAIGGTVAGLVGGAVSTNAIINKISSLSPKECLFDRIFFKKVTEIRHVCYDVGKHWDDYTETITNWVSSPFKKAVVIAGGVALAGLAGYGLYKLVSRSSKVQAAKEEAPKLKAEIKPEDKQIAQLDRQYRSVNEAIERVKEQSNEDLSTEEAFEIVAVTGLFLMMADDDLKRQQREEEEYSDYYKANIENFHNKPAEN